MALKETLIAAGVSVAVTLLGGAATYSFFIGGLNGRVDAHTQRIDAHDARFNLEVADRIKQIEAEKNERARSSEAQWKALESHRTRMDAIAQGLAADHTDVGLIRNDISHLHDDLMFRLATLKELMDEFRANQKKPAVGVKSSGGADQ